MGTMTPEEVRVVLTALVLMAVLMTTQLTTAMAGAATSF
jgi:hypothetical protein